MKTTFYSHGKLLISGEYAVLDGGLGLAIPTKHGQSLDITPLGRPVLSWKSLDPLGIAWFETQVPLHELPAMHGSGYNEDTVRGRLLRILSEAHKLNPGFLSGDQGYAVTTRLEFPREWGLGSSSTLINNIAQWAVVDAFSLHENSFGGSGYDIACAQHGRPILFWREQGRAMAMEVDFHPPYADRLFFVYLNKKQDSRESIRAFRQSKTKADNYIRASRDLAERFIQAASLRDFEDAMDTHENLVSEILGRPRVGNTLFPDFSMGSTKSLGAWGGDFILATGGADARAYFKSRGYNTLIGWKEMLL
jgi:mevalonate kinase